MYYRRTLCIQYVLILSTENAVLIVYVNYFTRLWGHGDPHILTTDPSVTWDPTF